MGGNRRVWRQSDWDKGLSEITMENLIFFGLGAMISLAISYHYYKRNSLEKPDWFSVESIKEILTEHPEDIDWTAKQIVKLYNNKVYDKDSSDPLAYNCCPRCGSEQLNRSSYHDEERDNLYFLINCENCEWSDYV